LVLETEFKDWFFLKNLDLAKTLLINLGKIGREILKISACFPFDSLLKVVVLLGVLLNHENTHYLKVLLSLLAISLSYPVLC